MFYPVPLHHEFTRLRWSAIFITFFNFMKHQRVFLGGGKENSRSQDCCVTDRGLMTMLMLMVLASICSQLWIGLGWSTSVPLPPILEAALLAAWLLWLDQCFVSISFYFSSSFRFCFYSRFFVFAFLRLTGCYWSVTEIKNLRRVKVAFNLVIPCGDFKLT